MIHIRHLFFILAVLAFGHISFAQTFSISPADTVSKVSMREDYESLQISQFNTSTDTISIKWQKVSADVPAFWDATICDNRICYGSLIDSGKMSSIIPGASAYLLVHITSHVNYGTAVVRYAVWDSRYPASRDTLTFIVNVNATTGIDDPSHSSPTITLWPNPSERILTVSTDLSAGFTYIISDISGREIQDGESKTNAVSLSIEHIPSGAYFISLWDQSQRTTTKTFIKQ